MTESSPTKLLRRTTPAGLPLRSPVRVAGPSVSRRDSKREALIQRAREEIAAHGFTGAHLNVIAARVGIRKSSFFHYFQDKESLYDLAVGSLLDDIANAVDIFATVPTFGARLDQIVECVHRNLNVEPILAHLMLRALIDAPPAGTPRPTGVERIAARVAETIELGIIEGRVPPVDVGQAALNVVCILCNAHAPGSLPIALPPRNEVLGLTVEMRITQVRAQVRGLLTVR